MLPTDALTRTPKKQIRARRFRAGSLYVPRNDFHPVAFAIVTMPTGLWKKKSSALAVDIVSAVRSQRDGAAKTVYVSVVVTTMHSGRYGMITQEARK
jgi:hypothetical protein